MFLLFLLKSKWFLTKRNKKVPNVVGVSLSEAKEILEQANIEIKKEEVKVLRISIDQDLSDSEKLTYKINK